MASPRRRGLQVGKAPIAPGTRDAERGRGLRLPHERDESTDATSGQPDAVMAQAQRDIENGLVDTDLRATPGLDAAQRERLLRQFQAESEAVAATPRGKPEKRGKPAKASTAAPAPYKKKRR